MVIPAPSHELNHDIAVQRAVGNNCPIPPPREDPGEEVIAVNVRGLRSRTEAYLTPKAVAELQFGPPKPPSPPPKAPFSILPTTSPPPIPRRDNSWGPQGTDTHHGGLELKAPPQRQAAPPKEHVSLDPMPTRPCPS